jgi:hypothetical protein
VQQPDLQLALACTGVLELRDGEEPVRVRLAARSLDPLAVRLTVAVDGEVVDWVFARDLLLRGLTAPTGEGAVRVRPHPHPARRRMLELVLSDDDGFARLFLSRGSVAQFLHVSDSFTREEISDELLLVDLEQALEDILTPGENPDQFGN